MQIIASYIQLIVIYNSTAHISVCIWFFLLKLKICMDNAFLPWLFPDPLTNFLTFPDRVKTLPLLVGGNSKVTNQDLWFFMNTTVNFTYFLGATRNSICSWKNVMTFYFYPYPTFKNFMKIFLSFIYFPRINSFPNATRMFAKQPVSEAALQRCS